MSRSFALMILVALAPAAPGQVKKILNDFPYGVNCLAFSPDSKLLATSTHPSERGKDALRIWDVATGKEVYRLGDYKLGCSALTFSLDGKTLLSNGSDDSQHLWDLSTRKVRKVIKTGLG